MTILIPLTAVPICIKVTYHEAMPFVRFVVSSSENTIALRALRKVLLLTVLALASMCASEPQSLDRTLEPYLNQYNLPAMAAAVVKGGAVVASGKAGTRRAGANLPVTIDDRFHIGSDSKAFTALLAGQFVEAGKLRWNSTTAEVFPELKGKMDPEFAKVTLEQLLSHSSGLTDAALGDLITGSFQQEGNMDEVRYWMVKETASKKLDHRRGSKFSYCNLCYTVAGAMEERVSRKTWEELIEERVVEPLGLKTAGFGPQATLGTVDAPFGHTIIGGKLKPMLPGPNGDNPLILGPAGTMHMSVLDFAKWIAWNAGEGKHAPALVSPATVKKLHTAVISTGVRENAPPGTPKTGSYALGWGIVKEDWATAPVITHTGSNNMNLALAMLWPVSDFGLVMMTNVGGNGADAAFRKLAPELYNQFAKPK